MPYGKHSITFVVLALVAALLTSLIPMTSAARKERANGKQAINSEEISQGKERSSGNGNDRVSRGDTYIIVLDQEPTGGRGENNGRGAAAREVAQELGQAHGLKVKQVYDAALAGFAAEVPDEAALRQLQRDPRVKSVEPDRLLKAFADDLPTGVDRIGADATRENALPTRSGAPIAVLDTGIEASHDDLAGVVQGGYDCTTAQNQWGHDVFGHGTHVAGIISALNNGVGVVGVAPGTPLFDVKVLGDDGSGPMSWAICGLDWVTQHAAATGIRVVNMSLGGSAVAADQNACGATTTALHNAICGAKAAGVTIVVAAGNASVAANTVVPATYNEVTTVSALVDTDGCTGGKGTSTNVGRDDTRASFSNTGRDLDVAAPGVKILSTIPGNGYGRKSGTSMAAPHVAAAYALDWSGTEETRKGVAEGILKVSANIGC
jgi:subtilisin